MLQDEILITSFLPIDGLASRAVNGHEDTALAQKPWNHPVKAGTFRTKSFSSVFRVQKFSAVFGICEQLEGDMAQGLADQGDVKEHSGVDRGWVV